MSDHCGRTRNSNKIFTLPLNVRYDVTDKNISMMNNHTSFFHIGKLSYKYSSIVCCTLIYVSDIECQVSGLSSLHGRPIIWFYGDEPSSMTKIPKVSICNDDESLLFSILHFVLYQVIIFFSKYKSL